MLNLLRPKVGSMKAQSSINKVTNEQTDACEEFHSSRTRVSAVRWTHWCLWNRCCIFESGRLKGSQLNLDSIFFDLKVIWHRISRILRMFKVAITKDEHKDAGCVNFCHCTRLCRGNFFILLPWLMIELGFRLHFLQERDNLVDISKDEAFFTCEICFVRYCFLKICTIECWATEIWFSHISRCEIRSPVSQIF